MWRVADCDVELCSGPISTAKPDRYTFTMKKKQNIIIIIITDLYSAFMSEDTEALDAAQED